MSRYVGLLFAGMMGVACSPGGSGGTDLGASSDLAAVQDMKVPEDQAPPPDQGGMSGPVLGLVAGGLGGSGSIDGTGASARFNSPYGMAYDGAGSLYVADSTNDTIRKVALATGAVTTLVGTPGMSGTTDGTGAAARFTRPQGVAYDGAGNLYVTDLSNNTLRKVVVATGAVTTLAGTAGMSGTTDGTGAAARFTNPGGVVADGAGNLYVGDTGNHTIRKVVVATGAVTTLAGGAGMTGTADGTGTAARFNRPIGLVLDGAGNLYVADNRNNAIRKVVVATGAVTTLAGTAGMSGTADGTGAVARFNGPAGIALDGMGNLYVPDNVNHTIRKVVVATGAVTTLAGTANMSGASDGLGTAARFLFPQSVALDGAGNLYVSDSGHTIRKVVAATGAVTTIVGAAEQPGSTDGTGPAARFSSSAGIVADGAGNVYVADTNNRTIRKVVVATGVVTTLAGTADMLGTVDGTGPAARFIAPNGLALDGAGNLYVSDGTGHTIRKVVVATGVVTTLAGTAITSGTTDGTGAAARFNTPSGLALDGAGNLYVADNKNRTIRKVVVASGVVTTLAGAAGMAGSTDGTGSAARFEDPLGLTFDGAGNLYVTDNDACTIRKVAVATGTVTTLAGDVFSSGAADGTGTAARFRLPEALAADGMGNLYVADTFNSTVRKIQLANASVTTLVGVAGRAGVKPGPLPAGLNFPRGVAALPSGELFILDESSVLSVR